MKLIFSESPSKTVLYLRSLIDLHIKPRRTVRLSGKLIAVNRPPARCEDVIFVTSTFHMSMESSFETQFKVVLLKTDPEHHFPDPHSFKLSNRTDNLKEEAQSCHAEKHVSDEQDGGIDTRFSRELMRGDCGSRGEA